MLNASHRFRSMPANPMFDSGSIRDANDAVALFHDMVRMQPLPTFIDFNKLLCAVVKLKRYPLALRFFTQWEAPVNSYTLNIVIDCFCRMKRADFGVSIVGRFVKHGHEPDVVTFNTLIKGFLLMKNIFEAEGLLKHMVDCDVEPDLLAYNQLISGYCFIGSMSKAREIFDLLVNSGIRPDIVTYNALMGGYCNKGRFDEVVHLFVKMIREEGLKPNGTTYSITRRSYIPMLRDLLFEGRREDALNLFKDMLSLPLSYSIGTWNILIDGLCSVAEAWNMDDGVALFDYMVSMVRMQPPPSVIDFNKLLGVVVKMRRYPFALQLLRQWEGPADCYTLNIAIDCFCRMKRADFGYAIFGRFFKLGHQPDVVTFNTLIKGFLSMKNFFEAEKLLKHMVDCDVQPDLLSFNQLISGYCFVGNMSKAIEIFDLAVNSGRRPDSISYNTLMAGYRKMGQFDEVLHLFKKMIREDGLKPGAVSFNIAGLSCNAMLRALLREGRCEDGLNLFKEMRSLQLSPSIPNWNILIDGLCSVHRVEDAFSVFRTMEDEGIDQDIVTYTTLIKGLCIDYKVREAMELFGELPSKSLQPDVVTYTILIGAFCNEGNVEAAKDLLQQMASKGCMPDHVTYSVFVGGLLRRNMMHEAIPLIQKMNLRSFKVDATSLPVLLQHLEMEGGDTIVFHKVKKLICSPKTAIAS